MAQRARRSTSPALVPPADTADAAATDDRTRGREVPADARALLRRYGARASSVKVYRWSEGLGGYEYLKQVPANEFSEERVMTRWGGGKYRGDVTDGAGRHVGAVPPFLIAGDPVVHPSAAPVVAAAPAQETGLTRIEAIMATMLEGMRELARAVATPRSAPIDDVLKIAQTLRELAPPAPPAPAASAPTDTFGMLKSLLDFQTALEERRPAAPASNELIGLAREVGTPVVDLMREKLQMDRDEARRRGGPPRAHLAPPAAVAAGPYAALAARLPGLARAYLASCARSDDEPGDIASEVVAQLPPAMLGELAEVLAGEHAHEAVAEGMCAAIPQWAPYPGWFSSLFAELAELTRAADSVDAELGDDVGEGRMGGVNFGTASDA